MSEGTTWKQADFNGDAVVNVGDLAILGVNYGSRGGGAVPEPAVSSLVVLSAVRLLRCKGNGR